MSLLEAQPLATEQTRHGRSDGSVEPSLYHELSSIPQARLLAFWGTIQSCLLILDEYASLLWICINEAFVRGLSPLKSTSRHWLPEINRINLLTGVPERCSNHLPGSGVFYSVAQDSRRRSLGMPLTKLSSPVAGSVTHPYTDLERWKQPLSKKHCSQEKSSSDPPVVVWQSICPVGETQLHLLPHPQPRHNALLMRACSGLVSLLRMAFLSRICKGSGRHRSRLWWTFGQCSMRKSGGPCAWLCGLP